MLYCPPHFGAAGAEFFGDASPADDHCGVVAQQAHNAAKPRVGGSVGLGIHASWSRSSDASSPRMATGNALRQIAERFVNHGIGPAGMVPGRDLLLAAAANEHNFIAD